MFTFGLVLHYAWREEKPNKFLEDCSGIIRLAILGHIGASIQLETLTS